MRVILHDPVGCPQIWLHCSPPAAGRTTHSANGMTLTTARSDPVVFLSIFWGAWKVCSTFAFAVLQETKETTARKNAECKLQTARPKRVMEGQENPTVTDLDIANGLDRQHRQSSTCLQLPQLQPPRTSVPKESLGKSRPGKKARCEETIGHEQGRRGSSVGDKADFSPLCSGFSACCASWRST